MRKRENTDLVDMMNASVQIEIDNCILEAMRTGEPVKGLSPMTFASKKIEKRWTTMMKKSIKRGHKLLKKYEST